MGVPHPFFDNYAARNMTERERLEHQMRIAAINQMKFEDIFRTRHNSFETAKSVSGRVIEPLLLDAESTDNNG